MVDVVFDVVGRSKTERITREGNREVVYRVSLKSSDGKNRLTLTDNNPELIQKYPLNGDVPVKIGACSQVTLSDAQLREAGKQARKASEEEE